jgi:hypothetical protein
MRIQVLLVSLRRRTAARISTYSQDEESCLGWNWLKVRYVQNV